MLAHRFFSIATSCRHATRGCSPRNPRQRAVTRRCCCAGAQVFLYRHFLPPCRPGLLAPEPPPEGCYTTVLLCWSGGYFSIATSCRHATRGCSPRNPRQRAVTRQPSGHPRAGALPLDPRAASHILVSADRFRFIHQFSDALTECVGSQRHRRPLCLRPGASLWSYAPPADLQAMTARRMRGDTIIYLPFG